METKSLIVGKEENGNTYISWFFLLAPRGFRETEGYTVHSQKLLVSATCLRISYSAFN